MGISSEVQPPPGLADRMWGYLRRKGWRGLIRQMAVGIRQKPALVDGYVVSIPNPPAQRSALPEGLAVREIRTGDDALIRQVTKECGFQYPEPVIRARLARGDVGFAILREERAVGYTWTSVKDFHIDALGVRFQMAADEYYTYDTFVLPELRGQRLHHHLTTFRARAMQDHYQKSRGLGFVYTNNRASLRAWKKAGADRIAHMGYLKLFGLRFHYQWGKRKFIAV